jgi:predicted site-specific integrase-resolvase
MLTPAAVAAYFASDVKTVVRWAHKGKLHCIMTPGGHRRYFEGEVMAMLRGEKWELPPGYAPTPITAVRSRRRRKAA